MRSGRGRGDKRESVEERVGGVKWWRREGCRGRMSREGAYLWTFYLAWRCGKEYEKVFL